jgi:hypothetical protein
LETKGSHDLQKNLDGKGNFTPVSRITYYKKGHRCQERFRAGAAAQTRAQEVRKELEKGTIHTGTFTAKGV